MLNRDLWTFINSFADWFSAFGTIAAVVIALYLARRDARITLKVRAGIRIAVQRGVEEGPEYLFIEITNVGRRPAQITNVVMRDRFRLKAGRRLFGAQFIMVPPVNPLSSSVPATITDGEQANYLVPWTIFEQVTGPKISVHFVGRLGRLRARLFRMGVATSAGGIFDATVEKELAERLIHLAGRKSQGKN